MMRNLVNRKILGLIFSGIVFGLVGFVYLRPRFRVIKVFRKPWEGITKLFLSPAKDKVALFGGHNGKAFLVVLPLNGGQMKKWYPFQGEEILAWNKEGSKILYKYNGEYFWMDINSDTTEKIPIPSPPGKLFPPWATYAFSSDAREFASLFGINGLHIFLYKQGEEKWRKLWTLPDENAETVYMGFVGEGGERKIVFMYQVPLHIEVHSTGLESVKEFQSAPDYKVCVSLIGEKGDVVNWSLTRKEISKFLPESDITVHLPYEGHPNPVSPDGKSLCIEAIGKNKIYLLVFQLENPKKLPIVLTLPPPVSAMSLPVAYYSWLRGSEALLVWCGYSEGDLTQVWLFPLKEKRAPIVTKHRLSYPFLYDARELSPEKVLVSNLFGLYELGIHDPSKDRLLITLDALLNGG